MPHARRRPTLLTLIAGLALSSAAVCSALAQPPRGSQARPSPAASPTPAQPASRAAAAEELPIQRITLYRSGVGLFQRGGLMDGNARIQLRFKTEQINDILKSLVLLDLNGGRVDAVSYPSKDPLDRRLASFGINIADNPSIPDLLGRLRGTGVTLTTTTDGAISGTILGVEERLTPQPAGASPTPPPAPLKLPHVNLITAAGIRSIPIASIASFQLQDPALNDELNKALAALAEYRAETTKAVDLSFSGQGSRQIVAAYVHEMPVWKTSYRLILPDDASAKPGRDAKPAPATATIHGWAVVENTTDQDWNNVELALVAGRPVSFQMDLYEPLYAPRPMLPVPMVAGVMPRQYQEGVNLNLQEALEKDKARNVDVERRAAYAKAPAAKPAAPPPPAPGSGGGGGGQAWRGASGDRDGGPGNIPMVTGAISADDLSSYAAAAQAQGDTVGEVFQYKLSTPVTIERQRSAMIPILTSPVQSRRVSIFNLADRADHPMRGVELTNSSDLQLLPGPLAVFEGGDNGATYAGDAQIGQIPPGDKRLLAYAVDLDVAVLTKPESTSTITRLRIVDGAVDQTVKQRNSITYGFHNKDGKHARTVLIEHPRLENWDLVQPKEAKEKTKNLYRFELEISAGKADTLDVVQEHTERQGIAVTSFDLPTILTYQQQGKVSDAVVNAFKEIAKRQAAVNESERLIADIDRQVATISKDQERIRENMKTVGGVDRSTDLYRRYATKLNEQESQLEDLAKNRAQEQQRLDQRKADLASYLKNLTVE